MAENLTTLERAKAWLAPDQGNLTSQPDATISRLVAAVSRLALNYMNRDTLARTVRSETYPGGRTEVLLLRSWPVLSVASLLLAPSTTALAASDYSLEPIRTGGGAQRLYLTGGRSFLAAGPAGVAVSYVSGFVRSETLVATTSDSTPQVTVSSVWLGDVSVTLPDGTPVVGYTAQDGVYTLPPPQSGQSVVVTYSHVPEDIEQAVIGDVGLLFRSRGRIGESSKALPQGAGTSAYLPVRMSDSAKEFLNRYCLVAPQ